MKKQKLTENLILDAFTFYNEKYTSHISSSEKDNLSKYILKNIEYDYILTDKQKTFQYPQNTLYLIYFIGEYKKAYQKSFDTDKDDLEETLASLGKGFPNKEKAFKDRLQKILDKSIDVDERVKLYFQNLLLLPLKKPKYKKVGMLILGIIYTNFPLISTLLDNIHNKNKQMQSALNALNYSLEFYQDTYISSDKILNSSLIVIYTLFTQNLKMQKNEAFKLAKELVNSFIDSSNYPKDKYREQNITEKNIYFAGIYNGMPIFQWYISNTQNSYYTDEDIKKLQVILRTFANTKIKSFTEQYLIMIVFKMFKKQVKVKDIEIYINSWQEKGAINKWIYKIHNLYVAYPSQLLQHLPRGKKSFILKLISLYIGILTKFTDFKSKFTKR